MVARKGKSIFWEENERFLEVLSNFLFFFSQLLNYQPPYGLKTIGYQNHGLIVQFFICVSMYS